MRRTKLLLDTNTWRYLVDAGGVETVRRAARAHGVDIVACPAVMYECLRTRNPELRRALAKTLAKPDWIRPMPEAFVMAEQLRQSIAAHRPEWMEPTPDLRAWTKQRSDWIGGFWRRLRTEPSRMSKMVGKLGDEKLALARVETQRGRDELRTAGITFANMTLGEARSIYTIPVPGWDGAPFDAWRASAEQRWWRDLMVAQDGPFLDWLEPWLRLERIRAHRAEWITFWTRTVTADEVPRDWLSWAMAATQATRKGSQGSPVDHQITVYLPDCDYFVTSDRIFTECVRRIRPHAPCPLATPSLSPAGDAALPHLLGLIETCGGLAD